MSGLEPLAPARTEVERTRTRWRIGLIITLGALWLGGVVVSVTEAGMVGAAWVRVPILVVLIVMAAAWFVLAARTPEPEDAPRLPEVRGGYGIDGPEQRRVRRALREGTPLRPDDRDRALTQARRRLAKATRGATSTRERYGVAGATTYGVGTAMFTSSRLTAPAFGSSDLWALAAVGLAATTWLLLTRNTMPGRQRLEQRARRRVEVLENHPVTE